MLHYGLPDACGLTSTIDLLSEKEINKKLLREREREDGILTLSLFICLFK
jgi:hypothetical protein